ncbi:type IV secretion system protein [Ralstonia holmesii]|uniref:type IV secretion system protein n=1 Tax=Ralstonia TaxID=48736 RepID=UPI00046AA1E9|nr:type IV secretion system protein [Ralstonia pickettii]MCM3583794.1 type IV secretion system protein [Ralstonia pickettii]
MASSTFADFFQNVDGVLQSVFTQAANGMSGYVLPIGWVMFGVSALVWSLLVMQGKIDSPMNDWVMKGITICLILYAAGNYYSSWISAPLFKLPSELSNAIGTSGSPSQILDSLSDKMQGLCMGIGSAMVDSFQNLNVGGGVILLVALLLVSVACILLLVAAAYNILYAKFGLAFVLAVGPFFVIWLIWKQTQALFYSWLNTALYFVFLIVVASLFIIMFVQITDNYMTKLTAAVTALAPAAPSASLAEKLAGLLTQATMPPDASTAMSTLNILSIAFQLVFICIPLFFIEIQLPTIVASMTSGQGGSVGSGGLMVMQAVRTAALSAMKK